MRNRTATFLSLLLVSAVNYLIWSSFQSPHESDPVLLWRNWILSLIAIGFVVGVIDKSFQRAALSISLGYPLAELLRIVIHLYSGQPFRYYVLTAFLYWLLLFVMSLIVYVGIAFVVALGSAALGSVIGERIGRWTNLKCCPPQ